MQTRLTLRCIQSAEKYSFISLLAPYPFNKYKFLIKILSFSVKVILFIYTVSPKNCTPKGGRHKFIKISSPIMIVPTSHRHSVIDLSSSKSLVWVEYQLQNFHGNQAPWQTTVVM